LPQSFYEANIPLIPKKDWDATKRSIIGQSLNEFRHKNTQKNTGKSNSTTFKSIINQDQVEFIPGRRGGSTYTNH
jgi:hypothetical protein